VERALEAGMAEHLDHARHEAVANPAGNTRNGKSRKTLKNENPFTPNLGHPRLFRL